MTVPWLILLWPLLVSHRGYYRGYESSLGRTGMRSDQSSLPLCAVLNNCPEMQELWKEVIGLHGSSYQVFIHRMSLFFELIIPSQHFFNHLINMACDLKFSTEIWVSVNSRETSAILCCQISLPSTSQVSELLGWGCVRQFLAETSSIHVQSCMLKTHYKVCFMGHQ